MTLPSVSRHVKVLEDAGLITKSRDAQFRPCRLETLPLEAADGWLAPYRQFFNERFDRLEDQLKAMMAEKNRDPRQGDK